MSFFFSHSRLLKGKKIPAILLGIAGAMAEPAQEFYGFYEGMKFEGLPGKSQLARLARYLRNELQGAIRNALALRTKGIKRFSDEKPMWLEGDMFSGKFEGFTSFKIAIKARETTIVEFEYVENGPKVPWKDELRLVFENGGLVIDDIRYGRIEGFTSGFGQSLKSSLTGVKGCE